MWRGWPTWSLSCLAIQVFPEPFTQAPLLICLAPSFPGMQRRGTLLSQRLSTSRRGREGTEILIRAWHVAGGGGHPISALSPISLSTRSLDFLGQLDFSIWAQEIVGPAT